MITINKMSSILFIDIVLHRPSPVLTNSFAMCSTEE